MKMTAYFSFIFFSKREKSMPPLIKFPLTRVMRDEGMSKLYLLSRNY